MTYSEMVNELNSMNDFYKKLIYNTLELMRGHGENNSKKLIDWLEVIKSTDLYTLLTDKSLENIIDSMFVDEETQQQTLDFIYVISNTLKLLNIDIENESNKITENMLHVSQISLIDESITNLIELNDNMFDVDDIGANVFAFILVIVKMFG